MKYVRVIELIITLIIALVTIISAWIIGIQMRRRIRRDLGRKATGGDLTSIETWMKVDEVEEKSGASATREWVPKYADSGFEADKFEDEKPIDLFPDKKRGK
jgi:hypothetical protein